MEDNNMNNGAASQGSQNNLDDFGQPAEEEVQVPAGNAAAQQQNDPLGPGALAAYNQVLANFQAALRCAKGTNTVRAPGQEFCEHANNLLQLFHTRCEQHENRINHLEAELNREQNHRQEGEARLEQQRVEFEQERAEMRRRSAALNDAHDPIGAVLHHWATEEDRRIDHVCEVAQSDERFRHFFTPAQAQRAKQVVRRMVTIGACSVCGFPGHEASYCWVNTQGPKTGKDHWSRYKQAIGATRSISALRQKQSQQIAILELRHRLQAEEELQGERNLF